MLHGTMRARLCLYGSIFILTVAGAGDRAIAAPMLNVVISEIMYHPPGDAVEALVGEYIELANRGVQAADLTGWYLTSGIEYAFPGGTILPGNGRLVVAKDPVAAMTVYGVIGALGPFEGRLSNGGDHIELRDENDGLVCDVRYDDDPPWPEGGDGDGRSIELVDLTKNHNVGRFWAPSSRLLGSAGQPNVPGGQRPVTVVINEFLANSLGGDWIELYNYGDSPVDLNGLYLTDDTQNPTQARIMSSWSAGTMTIPPKGHWLAVQSDFGFGLSGSGEQVYLVASDGITWVDGYDFGDQPVSGVSEGRYPDGDDDWAKMISTTPGSVNHPPYLADLVINEIMYHPNDDSELHAGKEYIEIHNFGGTAINLTGWRLKDAVTYDFPAGLTIYPNSYKVIAKDPAHVQASYGTIGVLGPYDGKLSNFSDEIELVDAFDNVVDHVRYRQEGAWPTLPDGSGPSLELATLAMDNRLPGAWRASSNQGTPGLANTQSVSNPPASVNRVRHRPLVPTNSDNVTVSARVGAGNLTSVTLYYKNDSSGSWSSTPMFDDGQHGDSYSGDGIFGGTISPRSHGTIVEFYIQASATGGSVTYPSGAPGKTCLYIVQNFAPDSNLTVFRFIMTDENHNALFADPLSNTLRDATFIYGDDVYYNCGVRFRGGAGNRTRPKKSYKVHLTAGFSFRGSDSFDLNFEKHDMTLLTETAISRLLGDMGLPGVRTEFSHTRWRNSYAGVHTWTEARNQDYLDKYFPSDADGNLYKAISAWPTDTAWNEPHCRDCGPYEKQTNIATNDWSDFTELGNISSYASDSVYESEMKRVIDHVNWGRSYAVICLCVLIDTPWTLHNQNYRLYRRFSDDRFSHILHDFDDAYWSTMYASAGFIGGYNYPDLVRFLQWPAFAREQQHGVWRAINETDGFYREAKMASEIAYYHSLIYEDVRDDIYSGVGERWTTFTNARAVWNMWLTARHDRLRGLLPIAPLAVTTNGGNTITTGVPTITLEGTAPISTARIEVFGSEDGINWLSTTNWQTQVTFEYQYNLVEVRMLDDDGTEMDKVAVEVIYTAGLPGRADFTTDPLPTEPPFVVQFYDTSDAPDITAWEWDFGDGGTASEPNPIHTYQQWGTYEVEMAITSDGTTFSAVKDITVGLPIAGDFDRDGDLDQMDFGALQSCLTGPGTANLNPACDPAMLDNDEDIDQDDVGLFLNCMTGEAIPADPNCP